MNLRKYPNRDRRRHGSLLVLAVVALVIIAVLGLALLQQNKMDRFAVEKYQRDYMDLVINGINAEIRNQLRDDYFNNRNSAYGLYDYPWTDENALRTVQREQPTDPANPDEPPYYDPQNVSVNGDDDHDDHYLATTFPIVTADEEVRWPHISNLTGIWLDLPQIGAKQDGYSRVPHERGITSDSPDNVNGDRMISTATLSSFNTNNSTFWQARGVDADGDSVLDAMWQWVPVAVRDLGGRKYVMAMRMIDSSSLINLNAATVNLQDDGTALPASPQWGAGYTPIDIDLSRLIARMPNTYIGYDIKPQRYSEIAAMLDRRFLHGGLTGVPAITSSDLPLTPTERMYAWINQASLYGSTDDTQFKIANELELRYGGGLNNEKANREIEGASSAVGDLRGLMRVTRNDRDGDGNFDNPPATEGYWYTALLNNNDVSSLPTSMCNLYYWFQGGPSTTPIANRQFPAVRHFLTTRSGHSVYNPNYGGDSGAGRLQYDLNTGGSAYGPSSSMSANYQAILIKMYNAFGHGSGSYLNLGDSTLTSEVIPQYALNVLDYADADYQPYIAPINGRHVGFERLPFLREAYFQVKYEERDTDNADGDSDQDTNPTSSTTGVPPDPGDDVDGTFEDWIALDGKPYTSAPGTGAHDNQNTRAMAIEIGNPFAHRMEAARLDQIFRVRIVNYSGGAEVAGTEHIWTYDTSAGSPTMPDIEPRDDTTVDDTLIIWIPPVNNLSGSGGDPTGENLDTELGFGSTAAQQLKLDPATDDLTFECDGHNIVVELQVKAIDISSGSSEWVTYDRMETGDNFAKSVNSTDSGSSNTTQDRSMAQRNATRNSTNINYILDAPGDGDTGHTGPTNPKDGGGSFDGASGTSHDLGSDNKSGVGPAILNADFQLPHPDRYDSTAANPDPGFFSVAEMGYLCMVGFDISQDETLSQNLYKFANTAPQRLFLNISPNSDTLANTGGVASAMPTESGLPYAAMLFDQFTVLSPRYDNRDNNADGTTDNEREQFIPGTINVNTASREILTLASSLLDVGGGTAAINATQELMTSICAYRDDPTYDSGDMNEAYGDPGLDGIRSGLPMKRTTTPGIASLGELLYINPRLYSTTSTSTDERDMQYYGYDGGDQKTQTVDLYPDPITATASKDRYLTAQDGPEERVARFQMLAQTLSVRSDVFAAYVVVRGYDAAAFNAGPVEEAHYIVIFDRGSMARNDSEDPLESPRIAGFIRLE